MKMKARIAVEVEIAFEADIPTLDLQQVEGHTSEVGVNEEAVVAARTLAALDAEALAHEAFNAFEVSSLVVQEVSEA